MNKKHLNRLAAFTICGLPLLAYAQGFAPPATDLAMPIMVAQTAVEPLVSARPAAAASRTLVDVYASGHHLTNGFGNWREVGVRGSYVTGPHRLMAELATMRRFGESGNYFGVGDTISFGEDWFASIYAGAGDGAFYLPRYRLDGFVNRRFLPGRNLIGTLGAGYYRAPDGHVDRNASVGATYYFTQPVVVQGEVRFNNSSPGSIRTRQQFVAATWGRAQETQVTGRVAWGREGYQTIGQGTSLVDFRSNEASVKVRHWVGPAWGVQAGVERYRNPFYVRSGGNVGFFWQLP